MDKHLFLLDPLKKQEAARKLFNDLSEIDTQTSPTSTADNEMLSLMIDEVLKGVDISMRYPTFYRKLLKNAELRQTFIEVLESMEKEEKFELTAVPEFSKPSMAFLINQKPKSIVEKFGKNQWRITLQQTIDQLRAIFSPPELVYRSDPNLYEDPWLTLLRGEIEIAGSIYTVLLECSLAEEVDNALAVSINIAVSFESSSDLSQPPLYATLQWGSYDETLTISEEGRSRFPYISLPAIVDEGQQLVKADLNLILETVT
jgi:hypothetical protein